MSSHSVTAALQAEIKTLFNQPDSKLGAKRSSIWTFLMPGLSIAPQDLEFNLASANRTEALRKAFNYADLVNRIDADSCDLTLLWNQYQTILSEAILADSDPRPEEIEQFEASRNFLYQIQETTDQLGTRTTIVDSPALVNYKQYKAAYLQAESAYNTLRQTALESNDPNVVREWALNQSTYRRQVDTARRSWITQGFKNEVDKAFIAINQIGKRNPQLLWNQWREEFAAFKLTNSEKQNFYLTDFSPSRFYQAPWKQLTLEFSEVEIETPDAQVAASTTQEIELSGANLKVDLIQVQVVRPWLNPTLFESRFWKWADDREPLSDGKEPPKGTLPAYTTSVVFARNLSIELTPDSENNASVIRDIKAGKSISWGLFSLKNATLSDSHFIQVDGMQVIALISQKLPKSPNPDPNLIWETTDPSAEAISDEQ